jgi:hypothetical protein
VTTANSKDRLNKVEGGPVVPPLPVVLQHANIMNVGIIGGFLFVLIVVFLAGFPRFLPVFTAVALAFWTVSIAFAVGPINPFAGYLRNWSRGWAQSEATRQFEARLLSACYDPRNRRRAASTVFIVSLIVLAAWRLSRLVLDHPLGQMSTDAGELIATVLAIGLPMAVWLGFFGATVRTRKYWADIMLRGPEWSSSTPYPGPLGLRIRSFLSGTVPEGLLEVEVAGGKRKPGL